MRLYILSHGRIECDKQWLLAGCTMGTASCKRPQAQWVEVPVLTFLIDHPEGKVLFDCAPHPMGMHGRWPLSLREIFPWYHQEEDLLENRLQAIGLQPGDIDTLVVSHLHMDHAGNLHLFTGSRVLVHRRELEQALLCTHINLEGASGGYVKADLEVEGLTFTPVEEDMPLLDGIEVLAFSGHTPGVLGLLVHLPKSGPVILPSDAIYSRENYGPPPQPPGLLHDSLSFFKTVEKVRNLQRKHKAHIFFSHDLLQYQEEYRLSPHYYE